MGEAVANAFAGLGVSLALVWALRALGLWDAPAPTIAAVFFAASTARAFVLRRLFRRLP
jgi:hypothetical protein